MKKTLLLLTVLTLTALTVHAKSSLSLSSHLLHTPNFQLRSADIDSAPTYITVRGLHQAAGTANFAELGTTKTSMPFPPALSLGLLLVVIGARAFGVNRAKELADHEQATYRGKSQMFRSLQGRA